MGVLYVIAAAILLFFPGELVYLLNVGPKVFGLTEALPDPLDRFFTVQAAALATVLAALSFLSAESPRTTSYPLVHLLAKVVTLTGFLYYLLNQKPYFAYGVGLAFELVATGAVLWHLLRIPRWSHAQSEPTHEEPVTEPKPAKPRSDGPSL